MRRSTRERYRRRPECRGNRKGTKVGIALPQSVKKLLEDKAYGHVVTMNADGSPQITMVWIDVDGDTPQFNTAEGRVKPDNLRNNPKIVVTVQSKDDPQAYAAIYGKASVTREGADAQIDKLAKRFLGLDEYPFRQPGEVRLLVKIDVEKIRGMGPQMQSWS